MKTIRIFALPSHTTPDRTSGVDFARIIQPMQHLDRYADGETRFQVDIFNEKSVTPSDWPTVAQKYDIIYLNYINDPWGFSAMGCMARKYGKLLVFDLDDNLWDLLPDNTAYASYHKGSEGLKNLTSIINEVDYVTTTNLYLKNVIAHNSYKQHDKIQVFPNYVDLSLYSHRPDFKKTLGIQLLHFGSTTHFIDLQSSEFEKGVDMILREYPNVTFKTVGAFIPKFKTKWGARYENGFGHQDVLTWIKDKFPSFMDETDILLTPLDENPYTRCKSQIKWLEGSTAKKPGVWQDIRQYRECIDGSSGFLARTAKEWHDQIKKLIDNPDLRRQIGQTAFEQVSEKHQIQNHVQDYANFFKDILDKKLK